MVCEEERIEFQAVAIFSFAYSKTEMAAGFFIMKEMSLGHIMSHHGLFIFASLFYFCRFVIKFSCIFMRKFSKEVTEWNL